MSISQGPQREQSTPTSSKNRATEPEGFQGNSGKTFLPVGNPSPWPRIIMAFTLLVLLSGPAIMLHEAWAFNNLAYRLNPQELTIHHGWRHISIPLTAITDATVVPESSRPFRRLAGTSLGGYRSGWFRDEHGRAYLVVTADSPLVLVETTLPDRDGSPGLRYVLSPAAPDPFIQRLKDMGAGPANSQDQTAADHGGEETFLPTRRPGRSPFTTFGGLALAILLPSLGITAAVLIMFGGGPSHLRYRVDGTGVTIQRRWRQRLLPWSQIKKVEEVSEGAQGIRFFGASLPGYYVGSFRLKKFGPAQVFATRLTPPLVALFTKGETWIISPADVPAFLAAVEDFKSVEP